MYTYISYMAAHSYSWLYAYCTYTQHVQKAQTVQYSNCEEHSGHI